jgi:hypothetical protein
MVDIKMRKIPNSVTLKVKVSATKEMRVRMWFATKLIVLAATVLGCNIEFEEIPLCE